MIEIRHLVKTYGDRKAVNDLNISMKPGKIYGFLGKNGAGKTTTMNIMTGYIGATSGDVVIDGHNILEEPELVKRQIGYLPEVPPLYPDMTVREYLDFAAELKDIGRKERAKAIRSVMEDVRVDEMQGRLIRNLSKGYRQRVGLAQALLGYPPILILDEPTSGLDPKQMLEMRELVKKLKERHTVILSTHILSEASAVCDYVFIISNGKIVASDTVEHLSEKLQTQQCLHITIKGDGMLAKSVLEEFPQVSDVKLLENGQEAEEERAEESTEEQGEEQTKEQKEEQRDGIWKLSLSGTTKEDIREIVSLTLAKQNMIILEMQVESQSLEEIFIELTDQSEEDEA